jgi:hypothetical protein
VGKPMTVTVGGTADGLHRLFAYGEAAGRLEGCDTWPYQEAVQVGALTLTSAEGEPLSPGHFERSFVVVPTTASAYVVCAYLDTTPSGNPDVFEYGCYNIPATPLNNINCYRSYLPWWVGAAAERGAREQLEKAIAERKSREEAVARQVREEGERRQAIEAVARKGGARSRTQS